MEKTLSNWLLDGSVFMPTVINMRLAGYSTLQFGLKLLR